MFFTVSLYAALTVSAVGLLWKLCSWVRAEAGTGPAGLPIGSRLKTALGGSLKSVFSGRLATLIKVLVVDVLLQVRVLRDREDRLLWLEHFLIFSGFTLLLLFHALSALITINLDPDFQPTLNPYLVLRNLFGVAVLAGLVLALIRRGIRPAEDRLKTKPRDWYALILIAVIILSGFFLEATKIPSEAVYGQMVEDYSDATEPEEAAALKALWIVEYGLVTGEEVLFDEKTVEAGRELNETSCLACHDRPGAAFISYPLSRLIKPLAPALDRTGLRTVLYYIHFLACFIGLALLAWTKMFHLIATPVSLMVNALTDRESETPAAAANRTLIEQDGCEPCGVCRSGCPVRINREERTGQGEQYGPEGEYALGVDWERLGARPAREREA